MNAEDVTAIIVTRGDVDLQPILHTLPYEWVIWDNSRRPFDAMVFGRYLATLETDRQVVYMQDDDVIFTAHQDLLAAYEPSRIIANMPSPWYEDAGYAQHDAVLVGFGALMDRDLWRDACIRYWLHWPPDRLFFQHVDHLVGILTPHVRLNLGKQDLPYAHQPGRMYTTDGFLEEKAEMRARALELRG